MYNTSRNTSVSLLSLGFWGGGMRHCHVPIGMWVRLEPPFVVGIIYTTLSAPALGNPSCPVQELYQLAHAQTRRSNRSPLPESSRFWSFSFSSSVLVLRLQPQLPFALCECCL